MTLTQSDLKCCDHQYGDLRKNLLCECDCHWKEPRRVIVTHPDLVEPIKEILKGQGRRLSNTTNKTVGIPKWGSLMSPTRSCPGFDGE